MFLRADVLECVCSHVGTCKDLAKIAQVRKLTRDYLLQREGIKHWEKLALAMGCVGPICGLKQVMAAICPWIWRSSVFSPEATIPFSGKTFECREIKDWRVGPNKDEVQ